MKDKVIFRRVGKSWTIGFFRCPKCQAMMPKVIETIKQEVSAFNIEEVLEHSQTCSSCGITLELYNEDFERLWKEKLLIYRW